MLGSHKVGQRIKSYLCSSSLTAGNFKCITTVRSFVVASCNTISLPTKAYLIPAFVCVKVVKYNRSILLCHCVGNNYKYRLFESQQLLSTVLYSL
jgi:hypothetical protein